MPTNTRYAEFLNNYRFFTNSVDFRISSSQALERWKNVQAFQLNEVVNGKFSFSQERREILLLKYDLWSKALYEIENYCIELTNKACGGIVITEDIEFIVSLQYKVLEKFKELTESNPTSFDVVFTEIYLQQDTLVQHYTEAKLRGLEDTSVKELFFEVVSLVIDTMQHTLIEIYEIDNLMLTKKDQANQTFLVVTEFDTKVLETTGFCTLTNRLSVYKDFVNLTEIFVKNYTRIPIISEVSTSIENLGVSIDYRKSSRFA